MSYVAAEPGVLISPTDDLQSPRSSQRACEDRSASADPPAQPFGHNGSDLLSLQVNHKNGPTRVWWLLRL